MADQQTNLLDPEQAFGVQHQRIYAPVFFAKLAQEYGVQPQSDEQAVELLRQAAALRQAYEGDREKTAAANDVIALGSQHLQALSGHDNSEQMEDQQIKQAAAQLASDPEIAHATLSLEAVLAAMSENEA